MVVFDLILYLLAALVVLLAAIGGGRIVDELDRRRRPHRVR
jgi:hypothetical protein